MKEKKKLNPIPLSLRDRKRYVVFEILSEKTFSSKDISKALKEVFLQLFGEIGLAKMNYSFIEFNEKTQKGIVRCKHTALEETKTGILFLKEINGIKITPKTLTTSGTLKKARSYFKG